MSWIKDWTIIWWSRLGHPERCRSDCDWCFKKVLDEMGRRCCGGNSNQGCGEEK